MADEKDLDKTFVELKKSAKKQNHHFQSSKQYLYKTLVESYFWWREASLQPNYLESLYEKNGIKFNKTGNQINFTPMLRTVWGLGVDDSSITSQWNVALRIIDEEYVSNTSKYNRDATQKLVSFIYDNGGLSNLRSAHPSTAEWLSEPEDDDIAVGQEKQKHLQPPKKITDPKLLRAAVDEGKKYFQQNATPTATVTPSTPVVASEDNFVVMLGRVNENGKVELLGSTDDKTIVANAIADCAEADVSKIAPNIRLITEAISTQVTPSRLANIRNKFAEKSKHKVITEDAKGSKSEWMMMGSRLVIRPKQNSILVSHTLTDVSVVTHCQPKQPLLKTGNDVFLRGNDLRFVVDNLIYGKQLRFMDVKDGNGLKKAPSDIVADYMLTTKNRVTDKERKIYFYDVVKANKRDTYGAIAYQADIGESPIVPTWSYTVTPNWIGQFFATVIGSWTNAQGFHVGRPQHRRFHMTLKKNLWNVQFSYIKDNETKQYIYEYDKSVSMKGAVANSTFNEQCMFSTRDISTVFTALFEMKLVGDVEISGNDHIMSIKCATELADYSIYIPTTDQKDKRDNTLFSIYGEKGNG